MSSSGGELPVVRMFIGVDVADSDVTVSVVPRVTSASVVVVGKHGTLAR
jgi:hypothetical protein